MHPILVSRARLGAYLLGWLPVAGLLTFLGISSGWALKEAVALSLPLSLAGALLFLPAWFLCRAFPLNRPDPTARLAAWIVSSITMTSLWITIAWSLARILALLPSLQEIAPRIRSALPMLGMVGIFLYAMMLALYYLLVAQAQRSEAEKQSAELRALAREAELKALRAQLNPHFLFNSLNSISALTTVDPKRAREMCVLLSDFFRKSLKLGQQDLVSLREELDLVRTYLAIEQVRFGARLALRYAIAPEAEAAATPPLLLQPLAENAIKHGIGQLPEGGELLIEARTMELGVEIRVTNPTDPDQPVPQGLGLGLVGVRQRLQGRFGPGTPFESGLQDGRFRVRLVLPRQEEIP